MNRWTGWQIHTAANVAFGCVERECVSLRVIIIIIGELIAVYFSVFEMTNKKNLTIAMMERKHPWDFIIDFFDRNI